MKAKIKFIFTTFFWGEKIRLICEKANKKLYFHDRLVQRIREIMGGIVHFAYDKNVRLYQS